MRDSEMQNELMQKLGQSEAAGGQAGHHGGHAGQQIAGAHGNHRGGAAAGPQDSLIQDSLADEDFNFGEKVVVNKNNYTLTYSGQGVYSSLIASMASSGALVDHTPGKIFT